MNTEKIKKIVTKTGTPFYLYDLSLIRKRYLLLRRSIPEGIEIFYAIKANPNKRVVSYLAKLGAGADVASAGELRVALKSGVDPKKISFAGPGKTIEELKLAVKSGISTIIAESSAEISALDGLASAMKKRVDISVRINPREASRFASIRMGGGSQQFGIDEEDVAAAVLDIQRSKYLKFAGLHMHTGSQMLSEEAITDNMEYLLNYCISLQKKIGIQIRWINFGGGFGIRYYEDQKDLDLNKLGRLSKEVLDKTGAKRYFAGARFIIEPGRYLVGDAGLYVTKILYKKRSRGRTFLVVDGGMHQNLAAAGLLGEGIRRNRIISVISKKTSKAKEVVTIAGCLCTPLDILARDIKIPKCEAGDIIAIESSGAYGYTASPGAFLSHNLPEEIVI